MMKNKEMLILSNLRNNSRESLTRLSRRTSIPVTTIHEKIKQYEDNIIKKYTMIIDFGKLGFNTKVAFLIRTNREKRDKLRDYLLGNKNVNTVFKLNNEYDFMVEGIFRELIDVESFLDKLENEFEVSEKSVFYIVDEIKREGFMSNPDLVKINAL